MYLSRIFIDTKKYESMKVLYNMEKLHGMVECSFSGEQRRNLWRLDKLASGDCLLLLSSIPPANNHLPEQIGFNNSSWETKSYDILLSRITNGSKWHFRLTANPTMSVFKDIKTRGKVKAITITAKQREWLKKQAEKRGFLLQENQYDVIQSEWRSFKKGNRENKILAVTFEGILTVTDPELFVQTLTTGIGREKAYGMGLLTIIPNV